MMSVPFEIPEIHAGFSEVKGTVRVEDDFLVFDIQLNTLGMFKQPVEVVKIEIAALTDIRLVKKIIRDQLFIRPKGQRLLEAIPGKHLGEVRLKVWRKYRSSALGLVDEVQFLMRKSRRTADR